MAAPSLFYLVGVGYAVVFVLIALGLSNEYIGMENTASDPNRVLGWIAYFAVESYGSLSVALFWAFANSTCGLDLAEASYGVIISFAQLGAVAGSTTATYAGRFGVAKLYGAGGLSCLLVTFMVPVYARMFPDHLPTPPSARERDRSTASPWSAMCEGLFLVFRYEYMTLLFGLSCLYEVVLTVLDYEMKVIGRARYGDSASAANDFAALMGSFGQVTNTLSFIFSLFGFSWVMQRLGLRRVLRLFPALLLIAALMSMSGPGLWPLFVAISCLKAMVYALNEPATELLYQPTTETIKFKAKAWIDVFGTRLMKAVGSAITHTGGSNPELLVRYGSVPTVLISMALLGISILVGKQFDDLISLGQVVGEDLEFISPEEFTNKGTLQTHISSPRAGDTDGVGGTSTSKEKRVLNWSRPPPRSMPTQHNSGEQSTRSQCTSDSPDLFVPDMWNGNPEAGEL